jgi:ferrous iron transport protein B
MDRLMGTAGLSGRAFIPLLSSFACAVPGIMATRTIDNEKDRLTTILVAPLMTCSARLPVYTLIIAAFIPNREIAPFVNLQGAVMFGLYLAGIVGALVAALALRKTVARGAASSFMMELPKVPDAAPRMSRSAVASAPSSSSSAPGGIILVTTVLCGPSRASPRPAGRKPERSVDCGQDRKRHRGRGQADRLQP